MSTSELSRLEAQDQEPKGGALPTQVDVLIVGAGVSGIGAAVHLGRELPEKSFAIVEALEGFGGTWRVHTYPGVRSDSDLYTYGYSFKPWVGPAIAPAQGILDYLSDTIDEFQLAAHTHFQHKVIAVDWSSQRQQWDVEILRLDTGETRNVSASFLWMNQGYYDHQNGHIPHWPDRDEYGGVVVHPQHWPADLDHADKRVVVVGSGATAATLVPALAETAAHVTMLQRSPTYYFTGSAANDLAPRLQALDVPLEWEHEIMRRAYVVENERLVRLAAEQPEQMRDELIGDVRSRLPKGYDVERHFTPDYLPFSQRIALAPDGDLFAVISDGRASVVTDRIDRFDEAGIVTASGEHLAADIVVAATGFDLSLFAGIRFAIDGEPLDLAGHVTWRGLMLSGVPNMVYTFGYLRYPWTLRVDLIGSFVSRLLQHLDDKGAASVVPQLRPEDADMPLLPWGTDVFRSGYVQRANETMFRRGDREPWVHLREYPEEQRTIPALDLDDSSLRYR